MAKISTYPLDQTPSLLDKVIGTDGDNSLVTNNYLISDIVGLTPIPTIDQVLISGNLSSQNIRLTGQTRSDGELAVKGSLTDETGLLGTNGQVLSSTGANVEWIDIPTPTIDQVLLSGNVSSQNIIISGSATFSSIIGLTGQLKDSSSSVGTSGQVLSSTGSNVSWIDIPTQQINLSSVLDASSFVNQVPSGLGATLQVEFGAAQGTISDPVQISSSGVITFNQTGTYFLNTYYNVQRLINSGGTSVFIYRTLLNSSQYGVVKGVDLTNINDMFPIETSQLIEITSAGTVCTFEVQRDTPGADDGSLVTHPTFSWSAVPSASIQIQKIN